MDPLELQKQQGANVAKKSAELHRDFHQYQPSDERVAWAVFALLAVFAVYVLGPMNGLIAAAIIFIFPFLYYSSKRANFELFKEYTHIYRNSKSIQCDVETTVLQGGEGVSYVVRVTHEGQDYICEPIYAERGKIIDDKKILPVHFHPETGYPLVIDRGIDRIWVERRPFSPVQEKPAEIHTRQESSSTNDVE